MGALYNLVFKRTSTFAVAIMGSVFFFERGFDLAADSIFESVNKGVSIEGNYIIFVFSAENPVYF